MLDQLAPVGEIDLDRLLLPMPGTPVSQCDGPAYQRSVPGATTWVLSADENTRAWYRWLVGHQASFCVWRLMSEALAMVEAGRADAAATVTALYDSYSALLLYSGSCTAETYASVIRSRMRACHPAFSGTWARDFRDVLARLARVAPAAGSPLKGAVKFNRLVHMSVAARLVPSGGSLLRDSGHDTEQPSREEGDLLDSFFLTDRGELCARDFLAQLRRLTQTMLTDLGHRALDVHYDRAALNDFQSRVPAYLGIPQQVAGSILRRDDER